jgi:hypothetical protein
MSDDPTRRSRPGDRILGIAAGRILLWLRRILHLRYVRATAVGMSLVLILGSLGVTGLGIRHQVSHRAILRYFARQHLKEGDLTPRLKNHATAAQVSLLAAASESDGSGGLVYAQRTGLSFYPHHTAATRLSRKEQEENDAIFPRLAAAYHAADLETLIRELESPQIQSKLHRRGVRSATLWALKQRMEMAIDQLERYRILRRAAKLMRHFVPYARDRYELPFPEKLRFYERLDPPGQFVGIYELTGLPLDGLDDSYGFEMSQHNHFLTIATTTEGNLVVTDFYRGTRRQYSIRSFQHPSGASLYKVLRRTPVQSAVFPRLG